MQRYTVHNILPLNVHVVVSFVSALLVQKTDGVHQLVYHGALFRHTAGNLKIYILSTADSAHAAPAPGITRRNPDVIALLARVRLESNTRVLAIVVHRVVYEPLLLRV